MRKQNSAFLSALTAMLLIAVSGCHSPDSENFGNAGDDSNPGSTAGSDAARRMVLADIGQDIILPALRDFETASGDLQTAVDAHAAAPADTDARAQAQQAWRTAMLSWQRNEALQLGPAGSDSGLDVQPGGQGLRGQIYTYPFFTACAVDQAALDNTQVDENTGVNIKGLGALEYLLFMQGANPDCPPEAGEDLVRARAQYAERLADFIAGIAEELVTRWEPTGRNFLAQFSNAGDGSSVYSRPQDALDALSVALFYVEQETKDRKIAGPIGIGATRIDPCGEANCPERLESRLAMISGANIRENLLVFRDTFTGVDDGLGINDLLRGIGRDDLADQLLTELDDTLAQLDNQEPNYDTAVTQIPSNSACINASNNPTMTNSNVAPCALHGYITRATDTFRGPIVAALSLATPNRAAGDND